MEEMGIEGRGSGEMRDGEMGIESSGIGVMGF